ncbi:MAG: threonine aldolase family protein [Paracoccaceae bacterium]|nr:threonine aldolase family protein [Paracoccaceae bacterium]
MEINLYSDTQTVPSKAMYQAMIDAPVGDEQHGRDPSVNLLCDRVTEMLKAEAALFLPSGTMCNVISFLVQCDKGDEVIAHETSHIITSEGGGLAAFSGAMVRPLKGNRGHFTQRALQTAIRSPSRYKPRSKMVVIEQTTNYAGGTIWPLAQMRLVSKSAREAGLTVHMDGARLFNASIATGINANLFTACCDTFWIDLTKGLGCPVGAILLGSKVFIEEARVWKQRLGGAMRQAGVLAGAGLFALDNNIDRLVDDHENARLLRNLISTHPKLDTESYHCDTNIVFFKLLSKVMTASEFCDRAKELGLILQASSQSEIRAVTHLNVTCQDVKKAIKIIFSVAEDL